MNKSISFIAVLALVSCNTKTKENIDFQDTINIKETIIINKSQEVIDYGKNVSGEEFDDFFVKFSSDSLFQISRIKFPLTEVITDMTGETEEITVIKGNWRFIDFKDNTSLIDGYTYARIEINDIVVKYEMQGIDNGILIEYNFHKKNNLWYLIEIQDLST